MNNKTVHPEQIDMAGYTAPEKIYESSGSIIFRSIRLSDHQSVVLKRLKNEWPTPDEVARFVVEFEMTRCVADDGVIHAFGLEKCRQTLMMVLEDVGGRSLADHLVEHRLGVEEALSLMIRLGGIIGGLHQKNIVHKDINPSNIIWNPETDVLKLIDFGVSTFQAGESGRAMNQDLLVGTLEYISPEQTGRIYRGVDHRSDLYSFGVTCFELLTGQRPFQSKDTLALVHSHIARTPVPPHTLDSHIPEMVSRIVMKLMAKTPEERYQSAYGLTHDLKRCQDELSKYGKIPLFELGKKDISSRFEVARKLQGRENERQVFGDALGRVRLGACEMILVSGDSGSGKSSLVEDVSRFEMKNREYFISGKFDVQKRSPYAPLIHAFQELVRKILADREASVSQWKKRILSAVGVSGQVLLDVISEVELIIGKQPDVPDLPPTESRNRFIMIFRKFVSTFSTEEHPLVLFLDDLQWADSSSLNLIEAIVSEPDMKHLLIIGAFRHDEISDEHPLTRTLQALEEKHIVLHRIQLKPLGLAEMADMLVDTLKKNGEDIKILAELCHKKTGGNPFFLNQFLTQLHTAGQIAFDESIGQWQWDLNHIMEAEIPDTIADLMISRIEELSHEARQILNVSACLGGRFTFKALAAVSKESVEKTGEALWEAIQTGLIIPTDDSYRFMVSGIFEQSGATIEYSPPDAGFAFLHDRVHQAVYSLIQEEKRQIIHADIGRWMLKSESDDSFEGLLFDTVNHLNKGAVLIHNADEREHLAELNLKAGRKAKASVAFQAAFEFFWTGLNLLDSSYWKTHYTLMLAYHIEVAEAAYLTGQFQLMEEMSRQVMNQARTTLDTMEIYSVRVRAAIAQNNPLGSVGIAIEALGRLGVYFPKKPGKRHVIVELIKTRIRLFPYSSKDLIARPEMTDPEKMAAMRIMVNVIRSAYHAAPDLSTLLAFRSIDFTLKYGMSPLSAGGFCIYGLIQCGITGDIDSGYNYGQLALDIAERFKDNIAGYNMTFVYNLFIRHWKEPLKNTLKPLLETHVICLENGRNDVAANAAQSYCSYLYLSGAPLSEVEREMELYGRRIETLNQKTILFQLKLLHQAVLNYMEKKEPTIQLSGPVYDEAEMVPVHVAAGDNTTLFMFYIAKMELCYLFGEYTLALECADKARSYSKGAMGIAVVKRFYGLDSLIRLAVYETSSKTEKLSIHRKVAGNQKKLKLWSRFCPENIMDRYFLVEAERYRVKKKHAKASLYYKKAIEWAKRKEHFYSEALPHERYALYWLNLGEKETAKLYLNKARHLYRIWGAHAKVTILERAYPEMGLAPQVQAHHSSPEGKVASVDSTAESLDLASVIKASQIISKEIELDKLLDTLMTLMAENAGAQKGFLILDSGLGQKENLMVRASFGVSPPMVGDLDRCKGVCSAIVRYVERTGKPVVLNHAVKEGMFVQDDYINHHRVKSVLCIPIRNQGLLMALLYLENNDTTGAFTPARVTVLHMLATQAAISMNNARLYTRYRSLFDSAVEGIFQSTVAGELISANPALANLLGYESPEDLFASSITLSDLFHSLDDRNTVLRMLREKNRVTAFDTRFIRKDGTRVWVSVSVRAVIDVNQKAGHFEGFLMDISERKEKEKALRDREAAESANRVKSRFLAMMSHEIRTPIHAIIGMTSLTLDQHLESKVEKDLTMVLSSAHALLGLVDDVLDYSKIEADKLELETVSFEIMSVLNMIFQMFAHPASEKGLELDIRVSEDVPLHLAGDPGRLGQVLINLVGNAVKFTEEGHIHLRVNRLSINSDRMTLEWVVEDTGIGIPDAQIHDLFSPFTQADSSISRKYGGTGLGLAICKELVGMMNGQIRVESRMAKGARFYFSAEFGIVSDEREPVYQVPRHLSNRFISDEDTPGIGGPASTTRILLSDNEPVDVRVSETALENILPILNNLSGALRRFDPVETEEYVEILRKELGETPWITDLANRIDRLEFERAVDTVQVMLNRHTKKGKS